MLRLGSKEAVQRPDGKWNIYRWQYAFDDDIVPRWVLIAVVRKPR